MSDPAAGPLAGGLPDESTEATLARYRDPLTIQRVIHGARTIAVVGLSSNPLRASHFVGFYLMRHGYRVIPVNPREQEVLGQKSYGSLREAQRAGRHRQRVQGT